MELWQKQLKKCKIWASLKLIKICCLAKKIQNISITGYQWSFILTLYSQQGKPESTESEGVVLRFDCIYCYNNFTFIDLKLATLGSPKASANQTVFTDGTFVTTELTKKGLRVTYLNDTEIT